MSYMGVISEDVTHQPLLKSQSEHVLRPCSVTGRRCANKESVMHREMDACSGRCMSLFVAECQWQILKITELMRVCARRRGVGAK